MARSTRFPSAVHVLALLAINPEKYLGSEKIASSVGTNSVVVRRLLSQLGKAGLVASQPGVGGGTRLSVDPSSVSLLDVYDAVEETCLFRLHEPHPKCPIARSVKASLSRTVDRITDGVRQEMASTRLSSITDEAVRAYESVKQADAPEC